MDLIFVALVSAAAVLTYIYFLKGGKTKREARMNTMLVIGLYLVALGAMDLFVWS